MTTTSWNWSSEPSPSKQLEHAPPGSYVTMTTQTGSNCPDFLKVLRQVFAYLRSAACFL